MAGPLFREKRPTFDPSNAKLVSRGNSSSALSSLMNILTYFEENFTGEMRLESIENSFDPEWKQDSECYYSLKDTYPLLGIPVPDRRVSNEEDDNEEEGKTMLEEILTGEDNLVVRVTKCNEDQWLKEVDVPFISTIMKPDITVYCNNVPVTYIEVVSDTLMKTIRKMYLVLLIQLIRVRACSKAIHQVTGLVLPKFNVKSGCTAVTVTWNGVRFGFIGSFTPICKSNLHAQIKSCITDQKNVISLLDFIVGKYFLKDCINGNDLKCYTHHRSSFDDIHFFRSRNAIVFVDYTTSIVYKCPIINHRLELFMLDNMKIPELSYPTGKIGRLFMFPLLRQPLKITDIRKCFSSFAISTCNALEALHNTGYAHMDVRRPNICFRYIQGEWRAVLIDLDGAKEREILFSTNKNSQMYNKTFDDLANVDWRQFSLLLSRVIENNEEKYHSRPPVFDLSISEERELQGCFDNGLRPSEELLKRISRLINNTQPDSSLNEVLGVPETRE